MSRAKTLVDAFFNRPVDTYRRAIDEIRHAGGLTTYEREVVTDAVGVTAAQCIIRHADPEQPLELDDERLEAERRAC